MNSLRVLFFGVGMYLLDTIVSSYQKENSLAKP